MAKLPFSGFASASNDSTIRIWSDSGEMLRLISNAHSSSFIYSLICLESYKLVSCGEDRQVCIWPLDSNSERDANDGPLQVLKCHAASHWQLASANQGTEFVVAASDGSIIVFTSDPSRLAPESVVEAFNAKGASKCLPSGLSEASIAALDTTESLRSRQGQRDGQVVMVKNVESGNVEAHSWSFQENKWTKIGDVVEGGDSLKQEESTDTIEKGKSFCAADNKYYDYVFQIDVKEGAPPLPLGFNKKDNPWAVADTFLAKHDLPFSYLDQIVEFLLKNTDDESTKARPPSFSAAGSFPKEGKSNLLPGAVTYEECNYQGILKKMDEFKVRYSRYCDEEDMRNLVESPTWSSKQEDLIAGFMAEWQLEHLFPIFDLCRSKILHYNNPRIFGVDRLVVLTEGYFKDVLELQKLAKCVIRYFVNILALTSMTTMVVDNCNEIVKIYGFMKHYCADKNLNQAFIQK